MDKHKRLFDLLPEVARPKGMSANRLAGKDWIIEEWAGVTNTTAHALIEHAARLHYEGEGYGFMCGGIGYFATDGDWESDYMPLIDALLAAAERLDAFGGEGEE